MSDGFHTMPSRNVGELEERLEQASKLIRYHHGFLDDCLRGIMPHDLVLIGAPSGLGKTDLALSIASSNAMAGKSVAYFALEAEPRELERRTKYALLSRQAFKTRHQHAGGMNYTDWLLGNCEHICGEMNAWADHKILAELGGLWTFYRGAKFDYHDLQAQVAARHKLVDLIVIDHLHYIDSDDENEAKGLGDTVKAIRDVSLRIGKPIILVAHLRKRDQRMKQLVATLDDFHGSSNVVKICTQAITLDHANSIEPSRPYLAPTFVSILKDRRGGAPRLVALCQFDKRTRGYLHEYTLGRLVGGGAEWEEIQPIHKPGWAVHHRAMEQAA